MLAILTSKAYMGKAKKNSLKNLPPIGIDPRTLPVSKIGECLTGMAGVLGSIHLAVKFIFTITIHKLSMPILLFLCSLKNSNVKHIYSKRILHT